MTINIWFIFKRTKNGLATQVFVSNKELSQVPSVWEWYFMDNNWKTQGFLDQNITYPLVLEITTTISGVIKK